MKQTINLWNNKKVSLHTFLSGISMKGSVISQVIPIAFEKTENKQGRFVTEIIEFVTEAIVITTTND